MYTQVFSIHICIYLFYLCILCMYSCRCTSCSSSVTQQKWSGTHDMRKSIFQYWGLWPLCFSRFFLKNKKIIYIYFGSVKTMSNKSEYIPQSNGHVCVYMYRCLSIIQRKPMFFLLSTISILFEQIKKKWNHPRQHIFICFIQF